MPGMDRTGPLGTGPIGRGMGPCGGGTAGRGGGRGFGRGRGAGRGYPATPLTPEEEKAMIEKETDWLESRLEIAKRRLEELGK